MHLNTNQHGAAVRRLVRRFVLQQLIVVVPLVALMALPFVYSALESYSALRYAKENFALATPALTLPLRDYLFFFSIAFPCVVGGGLVSAFVRTVLAVRRVDRADKLICADCLYDLRSSPARGSCPECGATYSFESLRVIWSDRRWRWPYTSLRP